MVTGLWYTHDPNFGSLSWFWRYKEHPCPLSCDSGFQRTLEVPGLVWHLDLDLDMITGLWYTQAPNFGSLPWFWRCKEHQCTLSPHLGLWRTLEVLTGVWHLDFDLDMITSLWYTHDKNFCSLSWFWRCKEHPCPLCSYFGLWRTLEVSDWDFSPWYLFGYGHWSLTLPCSEIWVSIMILKV